MTIYSFDIKDSLENTITLSDFKGKVLLIVNTASKCGFTPQYAGLQKIYDTYHGRGLEILAFPCNQFGLQEPGTNEEIQHFCHHEYGVTFPVFSKIEVNGEAAAPLYKYLKEQKPGPKGPDILWNFTKFLVNSAGDVVERFESPVKPEELVPPIENLLDSHQS